MMKINIITTINYKLNKKLIKKNNKIGQRKLLLPKNVVMRFYIDEYKEFK